jgi:hypothetical protein
LPESTVYPVARWGTPVRTQKNLNPDDWRKVLPQLSKLTADELEKLTT